MRPLPDNFSPALYDATVGGTLRNEPPFHAATPADVRALRIVSAASAMFLTALKACPWDFDATEAISWADHVAEHAAIDAALRAAAAEAERSCGEVV